MPAKLISKPPLPCRNARAHPFPLSPLFIKALTAEDAEDAEEKKERRNRRDMKKLDW
jgi:hypothetical protein